jgi:hypothetical protein
VTYTVGYPADTPTIFITAQISPFDPSANSAVGIGIYDAQSGSNARVTATMATNPLSGRQNTFQAVYQSGQGSPLRIQLFNYWSKPVTFTLDHSGLMYGDTYNANALMLATPPASSAPAAAAPAQAAAAPQAGPCQFVLGFKTLHDLDPGDIGDCIENQAFAPNGDAQQHSTKGLMAWRKADNWTAFTNGYLTWINGPNGLQSRLNTQRFDWEAPAPQVLNGSGTKVVPISLVGGFLQAKSSNAAGSSNFIVELLDSAGHDVALLANQIGNSSDLRATHVAAGDYVVSVKSDGNWMIELLNMPRVTAGNPITGAFTGQGNSIIPISLRRGLTIATSTVQGGSSNFIVELLDATGNNIGLLANRIGPGNEQRGAPADSPGVYVLSIQSDGAWSITIAQP